MAEEAAAQRLGWRRARRRQREWLPSPVPRLDIKPPMNPTPTRRSHEHALLPTLVLGVVAVRRRKGDVVVVVLACWGGWAGAWR